MLVGRIHTSVMSSLNLALLCMAAVTHLAGGYPFEVPISACKDMMPKGPGHEDSSAQNSKPPYDFDLEETMIRSSGTVDFTIKQKPGGPTLAAFMVQARAGKSTTPLGTFQPKDNNARTVKCSKENDTGSHNSPDPKKSVTLTWTPPTNYKGTVNFYVTVAESKVKFWVHFKAATLGVK